MAPNVVSTFWDAGDVQYRLDAATDDSVENMTGEKSKVSNTSATIGGGGST